MVLEADLDPADLASIRSVVSGTAPLDPDDADAFTAKYGIPVLVTYAATEFGGSVAGWNLDDHRAFWATKRGSVGRAHAGCELRVVDQQSGEPVPPDEEGLLEVKAGQLGNDAWVRTTDLARLDADGFLFILGRADQAIIRGGFKVRPDDVKAALERHPSVRGAAVVSRDDRRLGAVPVAVAELRPGAQPVSADDLLAYASTVLARYELPDGDPRGGPPAPHRVGQGRPPFRSRAPRRRAGRSLMPDRWTLRGRSAAADDARGGAAASGHRVWRPPSSRRTRRSSG